MVPQAHIFDKLPEVLMKDDHTARIIASLQKDPLSVPHRAYSSEYQFYWPKMKEEVEMYVTCCTPCEKTNIYHNLLLVYFSHCKFQQQ